jgi:mRNA-degrading endonuclease RelE of RelBE toxin-antitoxin system
MIFIETTTFTKLLPKYFTDGEYRLFQWHLLLNPEVGSLVRGSGGVRKVRWAPEGKGKRGGIRIMYYWKKSDEEIWLLTLFSKNEKASIPGHFLRKIAEEIENE